jgi:chromosome segregation ATPase
VPERHWFQCECPIAKLVCVEPGICSTCGGTITAQELPARAQANLPDDAYQAFGKSDYQDVCEIEAELDRALDETRELEEAAAWRRETDRLLESAGQLIQALVERVGELDADIHNLESRFEHVQGELATKVASAHHRVELLEARAYRTHLVEGEQVTQHQVDDLVEQLLRLPPKFRAELVQLVDAEALARQRRRDLLDRYAGAEAGR